MLPDISREHTKTIQNIEGPLKQFNTSAGKRDKYKLKFADGYEAEFCPLVSRTIQLPKMGQDITFKIVHRGQYGDEIDITNGQSSSSGENLSTKSVVGKVVSMNGHPAITAVNAAVKMAELKHNILKPEEVRVSDILSDADMIYDWLIKKAEE